MTKDAELRIGRYRIGRDCAPKALDGGGDDRTALVDVGGHRGDNAVALLSAAFSGECAERELMPNSTRAAWARLPTQAIAVTPEGLIDPR